MPRWLCCPWGPVDFYDCLRNWANPRSISNKPKICCCGKDHNCHDDYYNQFLKSKVGAPDPLAQQLRACQADLKKFIDQNNCNPIMVRLAWHDSGTYDQRIREWPQRGGANGAIRFDPEMTMGANSGLPKAKAYLDPLKEKYPLISWADLIQMASATAIECAGGPRIEMTYGRAETTSPNQCAGPTSREGFGGNAGLPDAKPPFGCGAADAATHLRNVFGKKMGFTDAEIVALSGAHTIGRAFKERSGTCPFGYTDAAASPHTQSTCKVRADGKDGVGMAGGAAWTKNWLTFDNTYFKRSSEDGEDKLLWFPTDQVLSTDAKFKATFDLYARDQNAFFKDYAAAHKKLSELGAKWDRQVKI